MSTVKRILTEFVVASAGDSRPRHRLLFAEEGSCTDYAGGVGVAVSRARVACGVAECCVVCWLVRLRSGGVFRGSCPWSPSPKYLNPLVRH